MTETTVKTLMQRLDRLERENRWWKMMGIAAMVFVSPFLLLAASTVAVPDEVRAKRLVVVDENGMPRIELGKLKPDVDDRGLVLKDQRGRVRAQLSLFVTPDWSSASLDLFDSHSMPRARVMVLHDRSPFFQLIDSNGYNLATLGLEERDDSPFLELTYPKIRPVARLDTSGLRWVAEVRANGFVGLDKDGKVVWKAP